MHQEAIISELQFKTSRSSGAGGQHVNKTESKVEVIFHVQSSAGLNEEERTLLLHRFANQLDKTGHFHLQCETYRSQHRNRKLAIERLLQQLEEALIVDKPRKPTKPSYGARQRRLNHKKQRGEVKKGRGWKLGD